jgi:protease IV
MRRFFTFWRVVAVLALALAAYAVFSSGAAEPPGPYVARHEILGVIQDDPDRDRMFAELAGDGEAKALILRINSPGGTTAGSEALFESLRMVAERKPVVAVMGEAAASGGYIAALAADRIVARGNTITGSIGVIAQFPRVDGLLDKFGVTMREVKSSPLKAAPSPFGPPDPRALEVEREMVEDSYQWFRRLVGARRNLSGNRLDAVADGRVFTGRQALEAGLIDEIGGERTALEWLGSKGIDSALPVADVEVEREEPSAFDILERLFGDGSRAAIDWLSGGPRLLSIHR